MGACFVMGICGVLNMVYIVLLLYGVCPGSNRRARRKKHEGAIDGRVCFLWLVLFVWTGQISERAEEIRFQYVRSILYSVLHMRHGDLPESAALHIPLYLHEDMWRFPGVQGSLPLPFSLSLSLLPLFCFLNTLVSVLLLAWVDTE